MFGKKKDKKKVEPTITEINKPQYYDDIIIHAAIKCINDALSTGQITHKFKNTRETQILLVASSDYVYLQDNAHEYAKLAPIYHGFPILDKMEIKSRESIENEKRLEKQEELDRLQICQAKDLAMIKKLARELGEKQ